jgi:type 1 glutamine amidotransferase
MALRKTSTYRTITGNVYILAPSGSVIELIAAATHCLQPFKQKGHWFIYRSEHGYVSAFPPPYHVVEVCTYADYPGRDSGHVKQ